MSGNSRVRLASAGDLPLLLTIDRESCEREGVEWSREERELLVGAFLEGVTNFALITPVQSQALGVLMGCEGSTANTDLLDSQRWLLQPRIGSDTRFITIFDLWIHPEHRRKGIATVLKNELEKECLRRGVSWIFTFQKFDNLPAIGMNQKLGYEYIGRATMWDDVERVCFLKLVSSTEIATG